MATLKFSQDTRLHAAIPPPPLLLFPGIYRSQCHSLHSLKMDSWCSAFPFIPIPISLWGMVEFSYFPSRTSNFSSSASAMTHTRDHPIRTMPLIPIARIHSSTQPYILCYQHPNCDISLTSLRPPKDPIIFSHYLPLLRYLPFPYNSTYNSWSIIIITPWHTIPPTLPLSPALEFTG